MTGKFDRNNFYHQFNDGAWAEFERLEAEAEAKAERMYNDFPKWGYETADDWLNHRLFEIVEELESGSDIIQDVVTPAEIEAQFNLKPGAVRQYMSRHGKQMIEDNEARKADKRTWLILRSAARRIWSRHCNHEFKHIGTDDSQEWGTTELYECKFCGLHDTEKRYHQQWLDAHEDPPYWENQ